MGLMPTGGARPTGGAFFPNGKIVARETPESRLERRIAKMWNSITTTTDPEERRRLLKKVKKLKSRQTTTVAASQMPIPKAAFQLRHKWHK